MSCSFLCLQVSLSIAKGWTDDKLPFLHLPYDPQPVNMEDPKAIMTANDLLGQWLEFGEFQILWWQGQVRLALARGI